MSPSGSDGDRGRNAYRWLSLLAAATGIYLLLTPWILTAVEWVIPGDRPLSCAGQSPNAKRCYLCGLTRGFRAVWYGDVESAKRFHPRAPLLFAVVAVEMAVRLSVLLALRNPRLRTAPLVRLDAGFHAAALAVIFATCVRPA